MGLSSARPIPGASRVVRPAIGFAIAASIMCVGQPAFAAGQHHHPAGSHTTKSHTTKSHTSKQHPAGQANGSTERARSADCAGPGGRSHENQHGTKPAAKAPHKHESKHDKAAREKAAREKAARERAAKRAAEQARKAAEKKAAEEKAAAEKAAAEEAAAAKAAADKAAADKAAAEKAAQTQAIKLFKATQALHVAHQQAVQQKQVQQQATAAAVNAEKAAHADAVRLIAVTALGSPVSIAAGQQTVTLLPAVNPLNTQAQNPSQAPAKPSKPAEAKPAKQRVVAAHRPVAADPILAIPTMIVTAGLSVGAAPQVLLALVLFSGLGLVVIGTYRRKTNRV